MCSGCTCVLIQRYGGASGVRDPGALEAALFRPQTGYYASERDPLAPGTPGNALYLSTQIDQILADHGGSLDDRALYVFNIGNNDQVIFGRRRPRRRPPPAW